MAWIRFDTAILFDEFCDTLTSDEFRAWCYLLLYVKSSGARGSAPYQSAGQMSRIVRVEGRHLASMLEKAGDRFEIKGGRIYVKNWRKYQEDYRDKSASPEKTGDDTERTTPPHNNPTPQDSTKIKNTASPLCEDVDKNVDKLTQERYWKLAPTDDEYRQFLSDVQQLINEENEGRARNPFRWMPTRMRSDSAEMHYLAYSLKMDEKRTILIEATNVLNGSTTWLNYVLLAIKYTIRTSQKTKITSPIGFTVDIIRKPNVLCREVSDGILSS